MITGEEKEMENNVLTRIKLFNENLTDASFESESAHLITLIKTDYKQEIIDFIDILKSLLTGNKKVIITVDNDFDGYSSARNIYYFLLMFGVIDERIRFIPLSSLHTSSGVLEEDNCVLIVTDTSYGHVKSRLTNSHIIWIDHHEIRAMDYLRARGSINGVFINSNKNINPEIKGLSCGALIYLYLTSVLEELEVSEENRKDLLNYFNRQTQQDALLSMISDVMEIEKYPGMIKGIHQSIKTELFNTLKNDFDYNNKKYFKKYIAQINNIIRMERFDILERVIRDNVTYDLVGEIQRLDADKKVLMSTYFRPCKSCFSLDMDSGVTIQMYELPLATNEIIRNFKGLMASIKIPENRSFAVFSYYKANNTAYVSCRNNLGIDLKEYIKSHDLKLNNIGGHAGAFGLALQEIEFERFKEILSNLKDYEGNLIQDTSDKLIDYKYIDGDFRKVSSVALYNEFNKDEIKFRFMKGYFKDIVQEPKRTVYVAPLTNGKRLEVISFSINTVKDEIVAKPQLKRSIYDLDYIEVGEF